MVLRHLLLLLSEDGRDAGPDELGGLGGIDGLPNVGFLIIVHHRSGLLKTQKRVEYQVGETWVRR